MVFPQLPLLPFKFQAYSAPSHGENSPNSTWLQGDVV